MKTSETISNISKALIECSAQCQNVAHNQKGYNYTYADLSSIIEQTKPILYKNGLAICQTISGDGSTVTICTRLVHSSGEWIEDSLTLPHVVMKGTNEVQNMGASITYGRRYSYCSVINIQAEKDTDGVVEKKDNKTVEKTSKDIDYMSEIKQMADVLGWTGEDTNEFAVDHLKRKVDWKNKEDQKKIYEAIRSAV